MEHEEHLKLLQATAESNQEAFAQLYEATSAQMYAVSLKMLKRKEWAEEAVQEAYVKIWHNASEYQTGKGTVLTWMVSIVRYRALDMLRYHKVRGESELFEGDGDSLFNPDGLAEQVPEKLAECIDELDSEQRQAIHLAYFNGLSHGEVGLHLQSPLGTIKSWIRRGLQSLQRCLSI
ncbi:RNA polymerase sigma factor [Catenovulum sediminis]|uniref:Sigma-70 family RNA polymerase sigma factor n=1 Tax=Catenovulum sediminis TaxID=1740262 RepID=A0ABV1RFW7_9ALTE|nr:sigma-70 family RNA polymerase sigma factor [Catenovulum sediminis]